MRPPFDEPVESNTTEAELADDALQLGRSQIQIRIGSCSNPTTGPDARHAARRLAVEGRENSLFTAASRW